MFYVNLKYGNQHISPPTIICKSISTTKRNAKYQYSIKHLEYEINFIEMMENAK